MGLIENEWFIEAPRGRICIVAWGDCFNPPVLVCHGKGDAITSFRPLMELLPTNFYYVGFELPGLGKSDPYPPGVAVETLTFVHCIETVRRHFRWEQFRYLAHSFGCAIGRFYNVTHPGRFIAAIELDQITMPLGFKLSELPRWYHLTYEAYYAEYHRQFLPKEERPSYTWEQMTEKVRKERPELTPDHVRAIIERCSEPAGNGKIRLTIETRKPYPLPPAMTLDHVREMYKSITTPTLAVVTENSVKKNLFRKTPFLLEDQGNYRVRKVAGGHDVHVAHPERVAPFVSQFLLHGLQGLEIRAKL
ncbi:alpha/beta hydrolase fold domain-containing protein [Phthorimaea operculella]|nr:alpha/beta hydrolase fold domain-containing protein [Phthorimaea operculella]